MKRIEIELPFAGFYESIHDSQIDGAIEQCFSDDYGDLSESESDLQKENGLEQLTIKEQ